jgi:hypothetical protein
MQPILDIADLAQRREAAEAAADGNALFYAFGNFCALAAKPDLASLEAMNRLKGRPLHQVGSVTTTPERTKHVFDWDRVMIPWGALVAVMGDLHSLGPIGFRGPASHHIPDHLTVVDKDVRTVQLISPGDVCPSNALVGDILDLTGEQILYITSANTSSNATGQIEAAHFEIKEIQKEFGHRDDVVLIGHRNERAVRRQYPRHRACSTSIVAFHEGQLVLERLGSLDALTILEVANRHGLSLHLGEGSEIPVPERKAARPSLPRRRSREPRRASKRTLRIHA